MRLIALLLCCIVIGGTPVAADTVRGALNLADEGKHAAAAQALQKLADTGNNVAKFYLGRQYLQGKGVPKSVARADTYLAPLLQTDLSFFFKLGMGRSKAAIVIAQCYLNCPDYPQKKQAHDWFQFAYTFAPDSFKGRLQMEIARHYEHAAKRDKTLTDQATYWYNKARATQDANPIILHFKFCEKRFSEGSLERYECMFRDFR
jgi:TPR repeat protein